jgi:hypothetical protein
MKTLRFLPLCVLVLAVSPIAHAANPEVGAAIIKQFGEAQSRNVVLVVSQPDDEEPVAWKAYANDPYRPGELLCTAVVKDEGRWIAKAESAGRLLRKVPTKPLDFRRLKVSSKDAFRIVRQAAAAAKVDWETMSFQLVANELTGVPEWGVALQDDDNFEVGFCVVSGEFGLVLSEDWSAPVVYTTPSRPQGSPADEGAEAARKVKQGVRKAWNWTENAGRKTGGFFKEIFR